MKIFVVGDISIRALKFEILRTDGREIADDRLRSHGAKYASFNYIRDGTFLIASLLESNFGNNSSQVPNGNPPEIIHHVDLSPLVSAEDFNNRLSIQPINGSIFCPVVHVDCTRQKRDDIERYYEERSVSIQEKYYLNSNATNTGKAESGIDKESDPNNSVSKRPDDKSIEKPSNDSCLVIMAKNDPNPDERVNSQFSNFGDVDSGSRFKHVFVYTKIEFLSDDNGEDTELSKLLRDVSGSCTILLDAHDLRDAGFKISRGISWDKTASDVALLLKQNRWEGVKKFQNTVIRFGIDGAIHFHSGDEPEQLNIYFYSDSAEGDFEERFVGTIAGIGETFCASLFADIYDDKGGFGFELAIKQAIVAARRLFANGYRVEVGRPAGVDHLLAFDRKYASNKKVSRASFILYADGREWTKWSLLGEAAQGDDKQIELLATDIVVNGIFPSSDRGIPQAQFNRLHTIDRREIESFRNLNRQLRDFLKAGASQKPISIAVFGPPGSGKSFGVKEVTAFIKDSNVKDACDFEIGETHVINVAQFVSVKELVRSLQLVRNDSIAGKVPIVFFDEFDTKYESHELGWLKFFLAPMQDGNFRDDNALHDLGKTIFVFAGGIENSFFDFSNKFGSKMERRREVKLPDFISRLSGFVNISGPNRIEDIETDNDKKYILRRAVLFRSLIKSNRPELFDGQKLRIDRGVLRAFLIVDKFKHGARSIEAIIGMSALSDKDRFHRSLLPTADQLGIHVDSKEFINIVAETLDENT